MTTKNEIAEQVRKVYRWIDSRIGLDGQNCVGCGDCCDFDAYDHRLYVTTPELICFEMSVPKENILPMQDGKCPYQKNSKCTVYPHRFAGCRIFCCKDDRQSDSRSNLSESAIQKFKNICDNFKLQYKYQQLPQALNQLVQLSRLKG